MNKTIKLSLIACTLMTALGANDLGTITVTGVTKTEQSIKDVTSNVEVITSEELEEKHISTVVQALNLISGINYVSSGGIGSITSVYLRGASNNRTLVLIDGIRYQDPSNTSGASIHHIMVEDIQRIEVIKGAQSGIWGADASAGVINIITKDAKDGTNGSIEAMYGSFDTKKIGATVSHKTKQFDIKLNANKITSGGFTVQAPRGEDIEDYEDDSYSNTTLNLKTNYNIDDESKIKINITNTDALKEYDSYGNADDNTMKSDIETKLYNISYLHNINQHNLKVKVEKSEFSTDEIGTVAQWGSQYVKVSNGEHNNLEVSDNIKYNKKDFILLGIGTSSDDVDYVMTDGFTKQKENKNNYIYTTNSNIFDKYVLTQSLRYDDFNNFDSKATGKLGVKYSINNDTSISSNIGTAYNVPNIVQELNPWGAVNEDLNPENSKSADISFEYRSLTLTYFYNKVTDLIDWYDPDGWGGEPAIYKNLNGESTFKGIEFDYKKDITEDILLSVNYTHLSAKNEDGSDIANRAESNLKLGVDYYGLSNHHFNINGEYVGDRKDGISSQQTGKYTVLNFTANYDWHNNNTTFIKIDNLGDKYYQTVDGYTSSPRAFYIGHKIVF